MSWFYLTLNLAYTADYNCEYGTFYLIAGDGCFSCQKYFGNCLDCTFNRCIICNESYYWNEIKYSCLPCEVGCKSCLSSEGKGCDSCFNGNYLIYDETLKKNRCESCNLCEKCIDSKCVCKPGHSTVPLVTGVLCVPCMPNCKNCLGDGKNQYCLSCESPYSLINGYCCPPSYYLNLKNSTCLPCMPNCKSCILEGDQQYCLSCESSFSLINGHCCPPGFFLNPKNSTCLPCKSNCKSCILEGDQKYCLSCESSFSLINGHCCPSGFFLNLKNSTCLPCMPNCKSCIEEGEEQYCLSCESSFTLINGHCCPPGCFLCLKNSTCVPCMPNCKSCIGEGEQQLCLNCEENFSLTNGYCCYPNCIKCFQNSTCISTVSDEFYINGSTPASCNKNGCRTCKSSFPNHCLSCYSGYYLTNSNCENCSNSCETCSDNCLTCSTIKINCTSCKPKFYLIDSKCCAEGDVLINSLCCPRGCLRCDESKKCSGCAEGFILNTKYQCIDCPKFCKSCVKSECECSSGIYFKNFYYQPCEGLFYGVYFVMGLIALGYLLVIYVCKDKSREGGKGRSNSVSIVEISLLK